MSDPRTTLFINYTDPSGRPGSIPTTAETWQEDVTRALALGTAVVLREVSMETALTIDIVRIR